MNTAHFSNAYESGRGRTIAFLLSKGVPYDEADEVAQSAWARGWEQLRQLREEHMLIPWVNSIALNLYRYGLRKSARYDAWQPVHDDMLTTVLNCAAIDVSTILSSCTPKDRTLLQAYLRGDSPKEMAVREGVSSVAIRIRLLRARRNARVRCRPILQAA
jgi:DNA-directed RNA polymerase specialized sigma24 family protein